MAGIIATLNTVFMQHKSNL